MVRIKVVKASHLLLRVSAALLVAALVTVGIAMARGDAAEASIRIGRTQMVRDEKEEVAAVFAAASSAPREVTFGEGHENEHTDAAADGFDIVILPRPTEPAPTRHTPPDPTPAPVSGKRVLIYHTHTCEAYEQTDGDPYAESEPWRTNDERHSVVRVGEELAGLLRGFGVTVVHDVTNHEPPKLGTAYVRSLDTLEQYANQPFDLYIDLHRDAYDEGIIDLRAVSVGGTQSAQLMALIGNGEGFHVKPDTERNLSFARALTDRVNAIADGLMRPALVKTGRYNQHIGTPAILIEVGHNKNTLKEALNSMPILARAIVEQLGE